MGSKKIYLLIAFLLFSLGARASAQPEAQSAQAPAQGADVVIGSYHISGVTAYDPEQLLRYAHAHEQASRGSSSASGIAEAIELIYREDGYFLAEVAGSINPVTNIIKITVHEGFISQVQIEGLDQKTASVVGSYIESLVGKQPIHQDDFERAFMLASDLSGVDLRSTFSADPESSAMQLRLSGSQSKSNGSIMIDNVPLRPDYAIRLVGSQQFSSILKGGDLLRLVGVGVREPRESYAFTGLLQYRVPVGTNGTYLELVGGTAFSERNFRQVTTDSEQRGVNLGIALAHPIIRDIHNFTYLLGEYEYLDARSEFGISETDSTAHAARLHLISGHFLQNGSLIEGSATLTVGGRPETAQGQAIDGSKTFAHFRSSIGTSQSIGPSTYLRAELKSQLTFESLPEVEKISLGHQPYLRGYAPSETEGDNGIAATFQLEHVLDINEDNGFSIRPIAFADVGYVSNRTPGQLLPASQTLASVGLGANISFQNGFGFRTWLAMPLRDGPQSDSGDLAVYVRLWKGW